MTTDDSHQASAFPKALRAAAARADRESIEDLGTLLTRQVAILQGVAKLLTVNYRWAYEQEEDGWIKLTLFAEGLYQQLHATITTAAILVGQTTSPPIKVRGLAHLREQLDVDRAHPLGAALRRISREIGLLRWLCTVRNKAVQHRAEAGYSAGRAMVMPDALVLVHSTQPVDPVVLQKGQALFDGISNKFGPWAEQPSVKREALTYLDIGSHELFSVSPHDFDAARRVVEEAGVHDLVVSLPVLENADACLAAFIGVVPENSDSPFAVDS